MGTLCFLCCVNLLAEVINYPLPAGSGLLTSAAYQVSVNGTPIWVEKLVGGSTDPSEVAVANFSASGALTVTITASENISSYVIRPKNLKVPATVSGRTLTFTLAQPQKLFVEVNSLPCLLFLCNQLESAGAADNMGRFNVRSFGAKGDGETDDTKAIQAALDAASKVSGTVFVPAGTFRVGRLVWHDHTSMIGDPGWSYYVPGGSILELNDPAAECLIDFTYCQGARLNGLSLVGRNLGTNVHGVLTKVHETNEKPNKWKREDFPAIERCMIRGFTGNGLDMDVWCMSLRASAIGYNRGDGLNYKHADALVIDNWFSNNQGAGIRAVQGTGSSSFTANRIEWNRGGNMIVRNAWGWNITGNSFDRAQGPNLYLMGNCHDFTITGNLFLRSGAVLERGRELEEHDRCAVRLVGSAGLTFTGNSITIGGNDGAKQTAPPTPENGLIIHKLSNSVVSGNRLIGTKNALLDLGEHGEQVIVSGNVTQISKPNK
jgi:hypothetical protein